MTDRIYLRISLDRKTSGSISKQRAATTKAATGDVVEYVDRSTSGSVPFADRPDGARLLADLQPGDRVLATKVDRVSRSASDLLGLVEKVEARGATVRFTEQGIDTDGPMGRFILTLLGALAEMERALISERRRESIVAFRAEGRHAVGKAPFGLRSVPNPNGRGLVLRPDPVNGPLVRSLVARLIAGESQRSLYRETGLGAPSFSRLLRNSRLAGVLDPDDPDQRIDPEQALFTMTEWQALQDRLGPMGASTWAKVTDGIGAAAVCATCGDRLYYQRVKFPTWRCRKVKHADNQPGVGISVARLDEYLEAEFLRRFGDMEMVDEVTISTDAAKREAVAVATNRLATARRLQDEATTEEEDDEAASAFIAAKQALREAKAMGSETVVRVMGLGVTFGEEWAESTDAEKVRLLRKVARWEVLGGRGSVEERVRVTPLALPTLD